MLIRKEPSVERTAQALLEVTDHVRRLEERVDAVGNLVDNTFQTHSPGDLAQALDGLSTRLATAELLAEKLGKAVEDLQRSQEELVRRQGNAEHAIAVLATRIELLAVGSQELNAIKVMIRELKEGA